MSSVNSRDHRSGWIGLYLQARSWKQNAIKCFCMTVVPNMGIKRFNTAGDPPWDQYINSLLTPDLITLTWVTDSEIFLQQKIIQRRSCLDLWYTLWYLWVWQCFAMPKRKLLWTRTELTYRQSSFLRWVILLCVSSFLS